MSQNGLTRNYACTAVINLQRNRTDPDGLFVCYPCMIEDFKTRGHDLVYSTLLSTGWYQRLLHVALLGDSSVDNNGLPVN